MYACQVSIETRADERKTQFVYVGEMEISSAYVRLRYTEESAAVSLTFDRETVTIAREGDYIMRLTLKKGETLDGTLGIGGKEGMVQTRTRRLAYSLTDNSFMLSAHYDLIVGDGAQDMRIRLFAKKG